VNGADFARAAVFGENKELPAAGKFVVPSAGFRVCACKPDLKKTRQAFVFASKGLGE
jgi:hypothetical protein